MTFVNEIPSLTWNWLKMNRDSLELEKSLPLAKPQIADLGKNIAYTEEKTDLLGECGFASGIINKKNPKLVDGKPHFNLVTEDKNHPIASFFSGKTFPTLKISGNTEKALVITVKEDEPYSLLENIIMEENARATVIFVFEGKASQALFRTKILAKENSELSIVKVQLLGGESLMLDDTSIIEKEGAKVSFTQIELGGSHVDSGLSAILEGYASDFKASTAYICKESQILDMNHVVYHVGKKSSSRMDVFGTLLGNASKTYRGTIDFKNGCAGSNGNEMEETLLLSPKAVNKSIPVILCDEEDVEGEHGATIGRLSKEILFYMQTRGIEEKEAEKIMSVAKIHAAADVIKDEDVLKKINAYLHTEE